MSLLVERSELAWAEHRDLLSGSVLLLGDSLAAAIKRAPGADGLFGAFPHTPLDHVPSRS
jgi:hypothetical protein